MIDKNWKKIIRYNYTIAIISFLLIFFLTNSTFADELAGEGVFFLFIILLAIIAAAVFSIFIKYAFYRYLKDIKISLVPLSLVMIVEIVIIAVLSGVFMSVETSWLQGRGFDFWVTTLLSYVSIDAAMSYFGIIFVENQGGWSLICESLIFVIILPFILYLPNIILLYGYFKKRNNRYKLWLHSYLFSAISPILYCMVIILILSSNKPAHNRLLSDREVKLDTKTTMLKEASTVNNKRLIEISIDEGADVNAEISNDNSTILHYILHKSGNVDTLKMLFKNGAEVNSKNNNGYSPLMIACSRIPADNEIVQLLITNGTDVNAQTSYGLTALKIAARRNQGIDFKHYGVKDTVTEKILLDHGADPNIKDYKARTALMEALDAKNEDLVKLLLSRGAIPIK
jgi:hypothetical protein